MKRLMHDIAFAAALGLMDRIKFAYREEQYRDLFEALYAACTGALEQFVLLSEREARRLNPSKS